MNTSSVKHVVASLVVIGMLSACNAGKAPDTASEAAPPAASKPVIPAASEASQPSETESAPTPIPDTADAIWKAIDEESADLKATIQNGALKDVHHRAFAIRDLVAALPTHSPTLPPDEQTKLNGEVKFVATLADRLDAAGDANDKASAQDNYDKLVAVLNGITRTK